MGLAIDGANRNDSKLVEATLTCLLAKRPEPTEQAPQNLCLDAGYDYDSVRDLVAEFGFTAHIQSRGAEAQAIKDEIKKEAGYRARRWVVERTHSWMNRFRRILIRWEKKAVNYLALLHLVCAYITFGQAGLVG